MEILKTKVLILCYASAGPTQMIQNAGECAKCCNSIYLGEPWCSAWDICMHSNPVPQKTYEIQWSGSGAMAIIIAISQ